MLGLAARLLGGLVTPLIDRVSNSSARLLRKLALFVVAGVSLVVVLIALTVAFDLWIASMAGAIAGALAVAGVYLAIAVVAIAMALRPAKLRTRDRTGKAAGASAAPDVNARVDDFIAPLLGVLQSLGLRREQLAVLAGSSLAKQVGPIPLVGLAIVAGFLIGRMWGGWRAILSSDLATTLLSTDLLASLFGGKRGPSDQADDRDEAA